MRLVRGAETGPTELDCLLPGITWLRETVERRHRGSTTPTSKLTTSAAQCTALSERCFH